MHRFQAWLGESLTDDEVTYLGALQREPLLAGRGREFWQLLLDAYRQGREAGYQEAKFTWEGEPS